MAATTGSSVSMVATRISSQNLTSVGSRRSFMSFKVQPFSARLRISCAAKQETIEKVTQIVRKQLDLSPTLFEDITNQDIVEELGAASLDIVEMVLALEKKFGVSVEEESVENIKTVQDAAELMEQLMKEGA